MYTGTRRPAWHRDVIWCAGLVAMIATAVAAGAFAWSRVADEAIARPVLRSALRATLIPAGEGGAATLDVRAGGGFVPGERFEALPGSGVSIDPTEVGTFTADDAMDRIAGVWSERLMTDGAEGLRGSVANEVLREQLDAALAGPVPRLIEGELAEEMMGGGLADGTRVANWPLQAVRDPDEPVQPIVGMFVYVQPEDLAGLNNRQIGELVLARLAEMVVEDGADAGRQAITNVNLSARYEQAVTQARAALHELFGTVLAGRRAELATRLEEARAVLEEDEAAPSGLEALLPAAEREELSEEEANERVLDALAERTWQDGTDVLPVLLQDDPRVERLDAARPVLGAFTRPARDAALRWTWLAGAVAVVAVVVMAVLAAGAGRLSRPGAAVAIGAAPGALLAWWLRERAAEDAVGAVPAGARVEGVFGEIQGLAGYLAASVPPEALDAIFRVHAVVAGVGAGLVLTAIILLLAGALRPRRRSYL